MGTASIHESPRSPDSKVSRLLPRRHPAQRQDRAGGVGGLGGAPAGAQRRAAGQGLAVAAGAARWLAVPSLRLPVSIPIAAPAHGVGDRSVPQRGRARVAALHRAADRTRRRVFAPRDRVLHVPLRRHLVEAAAVDRTGARGRGKRPVVKALVTGASGFLGSHIVDRCLQRGDRVRVLVRRTSDLSYLDTLAGVERVVGDLSSPNALAQATDGVEVVYHSAARVADYGARTQFWEENVAGTERLIAAARAHGVARFVFVSSPSAVMDMTDQSDIDETYPYPTRFVNLYSETKARAERLVLSANAPGFIACALAPRAEWGPRDRTGFLPKILANLRTGRMPNLSGGRQVLASLCYCENAAEACVLAARSDRVGGKAYFVTDAERVDVWQFAAQVGALFGAPPIRRNVNPSVARGAAGLVELIWKLPWLAHRRSPPISRYAVGLL